MIEYPILCFHLANSLCLILCVDLVDVVAFPLCTLLKLVSTFVSSKPSSLYQSRVFFRAEFRVQDQMFEDKVQIEV